MAACGAAAAVKPRQCVGGSGLETYGGGGGGGVLRWLWLRWLGLRRQLLSCSHQVDTWDGGRSFRCGGRRDAAYCCRGGQHSTGEPELQEIVKTVVGAEVVEGTAREQQRMQGGLLIGDVEGVLLSLKRPARNVNVDLHALCFLRVEVERCRCCDALARKKCRKHLWRIRAITWQAAAAEKEPRATGAK